MDSLQKKKQIFLSLPPLSHTSDILTRRSHRISAASQSDDHILYRHIRKLARFYLMTESIQFPEYFS